MAAADDQDFVVLNSNDIQGFNKEGILPLSAEEMSQIQRWLEPTDYAAKSSEYGKHSTSHLAGTGTWIFQTDQYKLWHNSERGALWIKAVAGAGKSVIAAAITSKLASEQNLPVLYFFFRHIVTANQKPQSLVRDYMSQLLKDSPELQQSLYKFVDDDRSLDSVSLDELWKMLISALTRLPGAYCIVDALDEMDTDNELFLHNLNALADDSMAIKVLMTSRPVPRVERVLRCPNILQITLEPQFVHPDISTYVQHRLSNFKVSEKVRQHMHWTMCARADGHFLYARLMMDDLLDPSKDLLSRETELLSAIDRLPTPMADMYTQMLLDHSQRSAVPQALQLTLLQWVTGSERPLRLLELASMIEFQENHLENPKGTKFVVREGCGPLLEILEDETVCPIHHSFTEYLYDLDRQCIESKTASFSVLDYKETQRAIAITCIGYLASGWHRDWKAVEESGRLGMLNMKYPFLDYAANNWRKHLRKSGAEDTNVASLLDSLLLKDFEILPVLLKLTNEIELKGLELFNSRQKNLFVSWEAIHVAAAEGLGFYVEYLIGKGHNIESSNSMGHTPLALAARKGHDDVVAILIRNGARSDDANEVGLKPIHHAATRNHHSVVKVLLESGVDPNTPKTRETPGRRCGNARSTRGDTPVEYACENGHVETIKEFVPYMSGDGISRALCWAIQFRQAKVANALLEIPGIDVNCVVDSQTPLYLACAIRDIDLTRLLLDMGGNASTLCSKASLGHHVFSFGEFEGKFSLLHAFAGSATNMTSDDWDVDRMNAGFGMLLDAGLDPNTVDPQGLTILHYIIKSNNENTLLFLLDRGLSATYLAPDGSNALHRASSVSVKIIDILTGRGVDINGVRKSDKKTPLMAALERGDVVTAQNLLSRGAKNVADAEGNTPLHLLAKLSEYQLDLDMVKALISSGADVNERNKDGNTPMHLGDIKPKLLSIFLERGFDLESRNKKGHTLLFHTISQWRVGEPHKTLVEAGASILARDSHGATILHALVGDLRVVGTNTSTLLQYFVHKDVDPLSVDNSGNTLWHVVAKLGASHHQNEQKAVMNLLMEYGISPTARNDSGQAPLHVAFSVTSNQDGYCAIEFLLEHTDADVGVADWNKIRPIHLASSISPELTCRLLELGADPTVVTVEGQNPLMVACRTRQCDIVCILLDHYRDHNQVGLIDEVDNQGRSALHYACKSGRPETVAMLIAAGANVNLEDKQRLTPLHLCAEYLEEQASWDRAQFFAPTHKQNGAAYILLSDSSRPYYNHMQQDPIRIRETIRLLVTNGADTSFLTKKPDLHFQHYYRKSVGDPLCYSIIKGCETMVSELLAIQARFLEDSLSAAKDSTTCTKESCNQLEEDLDTIRKQWTGILSKYDSRVRFLRMQHIPEIVAENIGDVRRNVWLIEKLLREDDEPSVGEASKLGVRFLDLDNGGDSPLFQMARWGFADLMRKFGQDVIYMNSVWRKEKAQQNVNWREERLNPILATALARKIPNLEMVKLLVSEFKLNINELFSNGGYNAVTQSFVHLVASPNYWWQTKALAFLLENGAEIDVLNSNQETPLIAALRGTTESPLRVKAVDILLLHGANPNAVDGTGLTCLNIAAGQPRCIRLLLGYGANPSFGHRPFIFDVIKRQDIEALRVVVKSGASVNILAQSEPEPETNEGDERKSFKSLMVDEVDSLSKYAYPIHIAACHFFNNAEKKESALEIIKILLDAGAEPFKFYEDGSSIAHALAEQGGILEPFSNHPSFNLESRDSQGRTLLLAACNARYHGFLSSDTALITLLIKRGASLTATDRDGCNAVHLLISALPFECGYYSFFSSVSKPFMPILASEPNIQGRTPFHYAVSGFRFDLIDFLVSHGADPLVRDPADGSTALHHLAAKLADYNDTLIHDPRAVMPADKISNLSTEFSLDPMSDDTLRQHVSTVMFSPEKLANHLLGSPRLHFESLLARGLSIEARDHAGETPLFKLMTATLGNHYDHLDTIFPALQVFEKAGANFKARNNIGESVLH